MIEDPKTPREEAEALIEHADLQAEAMLAEMSGEECVLMVRDFCEVMANWQPNINIYRTDPVMLGLSCLTAAELFRQAFVKAYGETASRLSAQEAIRKAFES